MYEKKCPGNVVVLQVELMHEEYEDDGDNESRKELAQPNQVKG